MAPVTQTNWNQVRALIALNAAVVISWIAYHNYQPKVLELFNFKELSFFLVAAQAVILIVIPSIAGYVGDAIIRRGGNSFIVFTVGISVTAMVFMCVAFTVGTATTINLTAALPFMIVIWLISMNIFHSPANSMLELFAPAKELPSAMALMVITTDLLYAFENRVVEFVDWIGPISTFALGGVLLIVTGYFFRRSTRKVSLVREHNPENKKNSDFVIVLVTGLLTGVATMFIKNIPDWITFSGVSFIQNSGVLVSVVLVVAAIAAWPLSVYLKGTGLGKANMVGLIATFGLLLLAYFFPISSYLSIVLCVGIGLSFSLVSISAFPLALSKLSNTQITLGAGVFFGSIEVADGIYNVLAAM
jgi:hypothetical protein